MKAKQLGVARIGRQPTPRTYQINHGRKHTQVSTESRLVVELEREQRILYDNYRQMLTVAVDLLADLSRDWQAYLIDKEYSFCLSAPAIKDLKAALREVA